MEMLKLSVSMLAFAPIVMVKAVGVGKVKIIHDRNGFQNWVFVQDVDQDILGHLAFFRKSSDKHGFGLRVSLQNCCQIAREFVITVFFGLFQKRT